jgi:isochorismate synthase
MNDHFLDIAEKKNIAFFAYRLPNTHDIEFGADFVANTGFNNGFVIGEFTPGRIYNILPALTFEDVCNLPDMNLDDKSVPLSTNNEEYIQRIENIISQIKKDDLGKVVMSRVLTIKRYKSLSTLFNTLCDNYPKAFVYCFHTIETGTWIGATPEVLIKIKDNKGESMALAGTRPVDSIGDWDNKNINEQQMVTDFIRDILIKEKIEPKIGETSTLKAGPVEHIHTPIQFSLSSQTNIEHLISELSPTPAVSGLPRERALELIQDTELHKRGCYGGFCGIFSHENETQLFVNLRCMQIFKNWITLYVGGGITAESNPKDEWAETEIKSKTLLKFI